MIITYETLNRIRKLARRPSIGVTNVMTLLDYIALADEKGQVSKPLYAPKALKRLGLITANGDKRQFNLDAFNALTEDK